MKWFSRFFKKANVQHEVSVKCYIGGHATGTVMIDEDVEYIPCPICQCGLELPALGEGYTLIAHTLTRRLPKE